MRYLYIIFLWTAYCALHSFMISIQFTKLMTHLLKNYYAFYRLFYIVLSVILFIPLLKYSVHTDNQILITYPMPLNLVRQILVSGSLIMFWWAFFFNYDSLSFFGIRQILNFGKKNISSNEIRKNGLLGVIRHPMYLALIVFLWCRIFSITDLVVNTLLTIYVIIGTFLEEKKLILEFGDSYIKYKQEVPMLIPFLKPGRIE
jgi:methanethiol S-methyltransferase